MHQMSLISEILIEQLVDACLFHTSTLLTGDTLWFVKYDQMLILKHNHVVKRPNNFVLARLLVLIWFFCPVEG